ncbi:MAG: hypothetical protein NTV32_05060, partial [Gammaproteobacteria bacterium]|nr:hypothetical protein [Gammaproteobacteria bacterium]
EDVKMIRASKLICGQIAAQDLISQAIISYVDDAITILNDPSQVELKAYYVLRMRSALGLDKRGTADAFRINLHELNWERLDSAVLILPTAAPAATPSSVDAMGGAGGASNPALWALQPLKSEDYECCEAYMKMFNKQIFSLKQKITTETLQSKLDMGGATLRGDRTKLGKAIISLMGEMNILGKTKEYSSDEVSNVLKICHLCALYSLFYQKIQDPSSHSVVGGETVKAPNYLELMDKITVAVNVWTVLSKNIKKAQDEIPHDSRFREHIKENLSSARSSAQRANYIIYLLLYVLVLEPNKDGRC